MFQSYYFNPLRIHKMFVYSYMLCMMKISKESHQRALTMNWPNFFKVQFMFALTTDKRKQVNSILEFN